MPDFTPGPWVQFIDSGLLSILPAGRPGEIAQVWIEDGLPNAEANARLISAAPDLYEALATALDALENLTGHKLPLGEAALAKARG